MSSTRSFVSRKIHSLLGVIPVGLFLLEHMITNYSATKGLEEFQKSVAFLNNLPFVLALEIFFIWLPILYHGIYGVYIAVQSKNNTTSYSYYRNFMFVLQRISGVVTLLFLGWHFYETRLQVALGNVTHEQLGLLMRDVFLNPVTYSLYMIGVISAVFHFCNGLWSFMVSWGIAVGPNAQRKVAYVSFALFLIISVIFILAMNAFTADSFIAKG